MPPLPQHYITKQYQPTKPQYPDTATLIRHLIATIQQTMYMFQELVLSGNLTYTTAVQQVISTILFPTASENLITLFCFNTLKKNTIWILFQQSTKAILQNEYAQKLFASAQKWLLFLNVLTTMKQNHSTLHKSFFRYT